MKKLIFCIVLFSSCTKQYPVCHKCMVQQYHIRWNGFNYVNEWYSNIYDTTICNEQDLQAWNKNYPLGTNQQINCN